MKVVLILKQDYRICMKNKDRYILLQVLTVRMLSKIASIATKGTDSMIES